jgi:ubiquinone/menaquinone biosynthesis C-methylase UbiE
MGKPHHLSVSGLIPSAECVSARQPFGCQGGFRGHHKEVGVELKKLFDTWAQAAARKYTRKQWLLSKWEVVEGIEWPPEKIRVMLDTIREGLQIRKTDLVVDLGCGGGWILKALSPSSRRMIGVDFSDSMLKNAKAFCPKEIFICGEIGRLPFKDNSFDRALSYFVFLNFMEDDFVQKAICDVRRVLKKGGRALIGQLPDKTRSFDYEAAKQEYLSYCDKTYKLGRSNRDICRAPQKLFDKVQLVGFLKKEGIVHQLCNSFNPFYRSGQPQTVEWRFDLILEK